MRLSYAPHRPADDVVDVQHPAGLFGTDTSLVQGEHGPLRDDEQAPQFGEPRDHVVGEGVGGPAAGASRSGPVDERHHRDGGAARRRGDDVLTAAARRRGRRRSHATRRVRGLRPGRPPCVVNRRAIETFGLEQSRGRRHVLLAFADRAAPRERGQQDLVDAPIERGELEPPLDVSERLVIGNALDEMLQQGGVTAAESPPLSGEPAVEERAAVDFQALQKVAAEERGQRSLPFRAELLDALLGRAGDLDRIDEAIRQVEPDRVVAGVDAPAATPVDDAPDLAEAPAELPARVVGNVPQQFAELAPRHRARREGQIGEERAHLAGCGQCERDAVPGDRQMARASAPGSKGRRPAGPTNQIPRAFPRRLPRSHPRPDATLGIDAAIPRARRDIAGPQGEGTWKHLLPPSTRAARP